MAKIVLGAPVALPSINEVTVESVQRHMALDGGGPAYRLFVSVWAGGDLLVRKEMWIQKGPDVGGVSKDLVDRFVAVPPEERTGLSDLVGVRRVQVDGAFAAFHAEMIKGGDIEDLAMAGMIKAGVRVVPGALNPTVQP